MKANMDAEYAEKMQQVMATRPDPSCAYDLPEKWEGEAVQTHGQAVRDIRYHRTQDMHVLRASDGAAIGYFPVRADAEQRMLSDEFVDGVKATVTVR